MASVLIGLAMFGSTVYLSQYFQLARGMTPTMAGLMSVAMVGGLLVSSIVSGRIITSTGRWKRFLVGGMVLVVVGLALLAQIDDTTSLVRVGAYMAVLGLGLGADDAEPRAVGAEQRGHVRPRRRELGRHLLPLDGRLDRRLGAGCGAHPPGRRQGRRRAAAARASPRTRTRSGNIPDVRPLDEPYRSIFEHAFGEATGHLFLVAVPFAVLALVCVLFIKEVPLRTTVLRERRAGTPKPPRRRPRPTRTVTTMSRAETVRALEHEVGVLIRRVRRVIGERARAVHPDLQPCRT